MKKKKKKKKLSGIHREIGGGHFQTRYCTDCSSQDDPIFSQSFPSYVYRSFSCAIRVSTRATIVKVMSPIVITTRLNIIAVGLLGESAESLWGLEIVGAINNLYVPEIARLAKSLLRKTATAHLSRGVLPIGLRVHHLTTPLDHGGAVC